MDKTTDTTGGRTSLPEKLERMAGECDALASRARTGWERQALYSAAVYLNDMAAEIAAKRHERASKAARDARARRTRAPRVDGGRW